MGVPDWADAALSRDLPLMRGREEGPHLEFMREYPEQARELAKEIAALATSGGGRILLGVEDSGALVGLGGAADTAGRDGLVKRLEGLVRSNSIKPRVTPKVAFAWDQGRAFLVITVPRGAQPVYYCENRPYIRNLRESRPAEPDEVIELVRQWLGLRAQAGVAPNAVSDGDWLAPLSEILVEILIAVDEFPERGFKPWLDHLLFRSNTWAATLRELTVEGLADEEHLAAEVEAIASLCDDIVGTLMLLDPEDWPKLNRLVEEFGRAAADLKRELIDGLPPDEEWLDHARRAIKAAARRARGLIVRMDKLMRSCRLDELRAEAAAIGGEMLTIAHRRLAFLAEEDVLALRDAARDLHLVETMVIEGDGGRSVQAMQDRITGATVRLESIAALLD